MYTDTHQDTHMPHMELAGASQAPHLSNKLSYAGIYLGNATQSQRGLISPIKLRMEFGFLPM